MITILFCYSYTISSIKFVTTTASCKYGFILERVGVNETIACSQMIDRNVRYIFPVVFTSADEVNESYPGFVEVKRVCVCGGGGLPGCYLGGVLFK